MGSGVSSAQQQEAEEAIRVLRSSDDGHEKINALEKLAASCQRPELRTPLVSDSLGLLPELKKVLRDCSGRQKELAAKCLLGLSLSDYPTLIFASEKVGLMKNVVESAEEIQECFNCVSNVVFIGDNHAYLLSPEVGLMEYIMGKLRGEPNPMKDWPYMKILSNIAGNLKSSNVQAYLSFDPIQAALDRLYDPDFGVLLCARMSCFPPAAAILKEVNVIDKLKSMHSTDFRGLLASLIVCNVVGKDEANSNSQSLMQSDPHVFPLLLKMIKSFLMQNEGPEARECRSFSGYRFGDIALRLCCGAIRTLSISDTNKPLMLKSNVLQLLFDVLKRFTDNAPALIWLSDDDIEVAVGGGGDDEDSAECCLEALLQLSFNLELDEKLRDVYFQASRDKAVDILSECITDPREKLSSETKRNASALLKRLKDQVPVPVAAPTAKKHVMLSYSWAANKHLVVALGRRLRELGHDVWRDEEGSSVLGPMVGDTDEMMASSIEAAHTVIIFVSPQYKESGNCRTEAKYSKQRQLSCPLKILYVMMYENYTTRSNPPIGGWLAFNIGLDYWYSLWDASLLETTAQALSLAINKPDATAVTTSNATHERKASEVFTPSLTYPTSPMMVSASPQTLSTKTVDVEGAWGVLKDPHSAFKPEVMDEALNELGVYEASDLSYLDDETLQTVTALLKPVRRNKLLMLLNKAK